MCLLFLLHGWNEEITSIHNFNRHGGVRKIQKSLWQTGALNIGGLIVHYWPIIINRMFYLICTNETKVFCCCCCLENPPPPSLFPWNGSVQAPNQELNTQVEPQRRDCSSRGDRRQRGDSHFTRTGGCNINLVHSGGGCFCSSHVDGEVNNRGRYLNPAAKQGSEASPSSVMGARFNGRTQSPQCKMSNKQHAAQKHNGVRTSSSSKLLRNYVVEESCS